MRKGKLNLLFVLFSIIGLQIHAAQPALDPAIYPAKGISNEYSFTNKWLFSKNTGNYAVANDLLGAAGTVRGMAVKNGKMLFPDRTNKQIIFVNGLTGTRENSLQLANNIFTYTGRNKANTADSIWMAGVLTHNDLKIDNAGNVLISNLITANTDRFQIWKIDLTTGNGTLVIDQANLASLFPTIPNLRFDAFGVIGDVSSNALIFTAQASSLYIYKWKITNGIVGSPEQITIQGATLEGVSNFGSAPQIYPISENSIYIDGFESFPIRVNGTGYFQDGFSNNILAITDNVIGSTMNKRHNGLVEFQLNGENFIVMAATGTDGSPASTFRLYRFTNNNKSYASLECLWTFPQAGMGNTSNPYRSGIPSVEVSGKTAKIYVYTGENGYGMYEFKTNGVTTDNRNSKTMSVKVTIEKQKILFSQTVKNIEVFNVAGQLISCKNNTNEVNINLASGIYIVSFSTETGMKQTEKIIIR